MRRLAQLVVRDSAIAGTEAFLGDSVQTGSTAAVVGE